MINIDVDDLAVAERFYVDAFGLVPARRLGADALELVGANAPIYLLAKPAGSAPAPRTTDTRRYERHWSPVHLDFIVDDLEAARDRAVAAGAAQEGDLEDHVWGRIVRLADPFGHGVCLVQFSERGYDAIRS